MKTGTVTSPRTANNPAFTGTADEQGASSNWRMRDLPAAGTLPDMPDPETPDQPDVPSPLQPAEEAATPQAAAAVAAMMAAEQAVSRSVEQMARQFQRNTS